MVSDRWVLGSLVTAIVGKAGAAGLRLRGRVEVGGMPNLVAGTLVSLGALGADGVADDVAGVGLGAAAASRRMLVNDAVRM